MTPPRPKSRLAPAMIVAGVLLVVLGLYVGTYIWLVEPIENTFGPNIVVTTYRVGDDWQEAADWIFGPINWIDRQVRSEVWSRDV